MYVNGKLGAELEGEVGSGWAYGALCSTSSLCKSKTTNKKSINDCFLNTSLCCWSCMVLDEKSDIILFFFVYVASFFFLLAAFKIIFFALEQYKYVLSRFLCVHMPVCMHAIFTFLAYNTYQSFWDLWIYVFHYFWKSIFIYSYFLFSYFFLDSPCLYVSSTDGNLHF